MKNLRLHNGSVSKSACSVSVRTGVWIHSTHAKSQACLLVPVISASGGADRRIPRLHWLASPAVILCFLFSEGSCFKEESQRKTNEDIWCSAVVSMFAFTDTCIYTHSLNTYNHTWKRVEFLIGKTSWRVIRLYGTAFRKNNVCSSGVCHISRI